MTIEDAYRVVMERLPGWRLISTYATLVAGDKVGAPTEQRVLVTIGHLRESIQSQWNDYDSSYESSGRTLEEALDVAFGRTV